MSKMTNLLISSLGIDYTYKRLMELLSESCDLKYKKKIMTGVTDRSSEKKGDTPEGRATSQERQDDDQNQNDPSNDNPNEFVGVILRKKSRKYSMSSAKFSPLISSAKTVVDFGQEDENGLKAVGGGHLSIREACAVMQFLCGLRDMENNEDSGCYHVPVALNAVLTNMIKYCRWLSPQEFKSMLDLSCNLLKKIQNRPPSPDNFVHHHHQQQHRDSEVKGRGQLYSSQQQTSSGVTSSCETASDALQEIREEVECESLQTIISNTGLSSNVVNETDQAMTPTVTPSTEDYSSSSAFSSLEPSSLTSVASSTRTLLIADSTEEDDEAGLQRKGQATASPEEDKEQENANNTKEYEDESSSLTIILRVKQLFALFVQTRLVSYDDQEGTASTIKTGDQDDRLPLLNKCFLQLMLTQGNKDVIGNDDGHEINSNRSQHFLNEAIEGLSSRVNGSLLSSSCSMQSCCHTRVDSNLASLSSCSCRCGCCLPLNVNISSVYDDICQLLIQSSLIPKTQDEFTAEMRSFSPSNNPSFDDAGIQEGNYGKISSRKSDNLLRHVIEGDIDSLESGHDESSSVVLLSDSSNWIRHLLVLSTFGQKACTSCTPSLTTSLPANLRIAFSSISTYLSLVRILKGHELKLPISTIESIAKTTPLSSPVLEFTSSAFSSVKSDSLNRITQTNRSRTSSPTSSLDHLKLVDPLLSSRDLTEVSKITRFYPVVTALLWDKMSDSYSDLHLQTSNLLQQIHNLSSEESNPICESVICSSMASADEVTSFETRKRFCTLFSITRDIESRFPSVHPGSFTAVNNTINSGNSSTDNNSNFLFQRREFDRPLFFMLDSLSHKLDSHNTQAVDWLHQSIKNGDMARILEPLLFILLHPDTSRVSVQHVNLQHPDNLVDSTGRTSTLPDQDAADSAAQAAAEARIYAISSTGGHVMYHVTPEGKTGVRTRAEAPSAARSIHKVVTVTSQGSLSHSSSSSSLRSGSKWVTTRFNIPDYEVPPSHENNIISGKYTSMKMTLNPLGSMSSLASADTIGDETAVKGVTASSSAAEVSSISSAPGNLTSLKKLGQNGGIPFHQDSFDLNRLHKQASNRNVNFAANNRSEVKSGNATDLPLIKTESDEGVLCESGSDSGSETEVVVTNLLDELVDKIARDEGEDIGDDDAAEALDDEEEDTSSSSSDATTTQALASESMSMNSWAKPVSVNQLHCHLLLYSQVYDSRRTLYALSTLWNIILTHPSKVLFTLSTTSVSNRLGSRSQELQSLCARHRKSLLGKGFYSELDIESITSFRSHTFLEVIITTCLYYIRSYYPRLPNTARLTADEILGNQKVRVLSCEILRLIFSELIAIIKDKPTTHPFSSYINDLLMRCKVQKSVLHSLVSCVYNYQFKSNSDNKSNNNNNNEDYFLDMITDLNDKITGDSSFQEDMQKSLLKLLEQLMILEHKSSPKSLHDKEYPTHNRKGSDSKASRIRFQPPMASLKYCPNVPIPSQAMFLSAIQTALQQSCKASLHPNWLQLVEATLPFAGRSLTRLVVCVVCQMCNNLEGLSNTITRFKKHHLEADGASNLEQEVTMTPNHLIVILKSLGNLCHHCLCDSGTASGSTSPVLSQSPLHNNTNTNTGGSVISLNPLSTISNLLHVLTSESMMNDNHSSHPRDSSHDPLTSTRRTLLTHLARILSALRNIWKAVSFETPDVEVKKHSRSPSVTSTSSFGRQASLMTTSVNGWQVMGSTKDVKLAVLDLLSPISLLHGSNFMGAVAVVWYELREAKTAKNNKTPGAPVSVIPKCSQDQMILVELIAAVKVLPMDLIIQHVKQALKTPPQSSHSRKKQIALEVCLLQFFLAYIRLHASSDKSQQLYDCWKSLLSLIRDGLSCSSNQPMAQFHLLAILNEFVQAAPLLEDRRDQKELQDVAQKLVDTCTNVAGAGLSQSRWLRRNLEVRPGIQHDSVHDDETDGESNESSRPTGVVRDATDGDNSSFLSKFSVHALNALAEVCLPVFE